ncbi:uncharacterized protein KY384_002219 [Bacidia gigantensis]|uniref:uncharacterized protein n=1 Tax=Bacidia gigantensis TaxID=2732470 RepID=UPI001D04328B|nr:uncharacterized protein KY384_002219 [Bacidia gigantensis]KAG8533436.1 hypothetical protein KY384_002219 [Bacidia gigantensis]
MSAATPQVSSANGDGVGPDAPKAPFKPRWPKYSPTRILNYEATSQNTSEPSPLHISQGESPVHDQQEPFDSSSSAMQEADSMMTGTSEHSIENGSKPRTQTLPVPKEAPLQRPKASTVSSNVTEVPLQRPQHYEEEIAFSDIVATFAVDVSGSTEGRVLEEEKDAINLLCSGLSRDAQSQAQIIPWSHVTHRVIRPTEIDSLQPGGGTVPNCLNQETDSRKALSMCSAWFLLTDGQVDHHEVLDFSKGVCEASLHGTPCVIILFGYKTSRPVQANVSVGLSVFSNAADCLFLFHDIDSTQVYVLQSKGKFNQILPPGCRELLLDQTTLWGSLPNFHYRELFDLPLPARQQLQPDDLLLQSGKRVNLQNLFHDQVGSLEAREIMENDDNLKSVLLAAQLRGRDDDVGSWVSKQKLDKDSILQCDRPDLGMKAFLSMQHLLELLFCQGIDYSRIRLWKQELRSAHYMNWRSFVTGAIAHHDSTRSRDTVVRDSMSRLRSNRREMDTGVHSPHMMVPVSPTPSLQGGFTKNMSYSEYYDTSNVSGPPAPPTMSRRQLPGHGDPDSNRIGTQYVGKQQLSSLKVRLGKDSGILYIPGYKDEFSNPSVAGLCPICDEKDIPLVVLLKAPPQGLATPGFPSPNQRKGLVYPLAMGSYPETDVLSSQVCCDSCAFILVQNNMSVRDDNIVGAIPILESAFTGKCNQTTFKAIDKALQHRFHESAVFLVFLAVIFSTIANTEDDASDVSLSALQSLASLVAKHTELPVNLSMSINESTPRTGTFGNPRPLQRVISQNFLGIWEPDCPLLQHPLEGFVVLALTAQNLGVYGLLNHRVDVPLAVLHRFLYHLVEKHCACGKKDQSAASTALNAIIQDLQKAGRPYESVFEPPRGKDVEDPDVSMTGETSGLQQMSSTILKGTYLVSDEELEEFDRLDDFAAVVKMPVSKLETFPKSLLLEASQNTYASGVFEVLRASEVLNDTFNIE